jgi:hypothetical protein
MSTLAHWHTLVGTWTGTSRLLLPDEPPRESPSTASIAVIAQGKFCTLAYTWVFDGQPQDGLVVFGYDPDRRAMDAIFVDSWHMGDKLMRLQGQDAAQDTVDVRGSYAVDASPDWGWRLVIEPGDTAWCMLMYNVAPDGEEFLGVEATYTRSVA